MEPLKLARRLPLTGSILQIVLSRFGSVEAYDRQLELNRDALLSVASEPMSFYKRCRLAGLSTAQGAHLMKSFPGLREILLQRGVIFRQATSYGQRPVPIPTAPKRNAVDFVPVTERRPGREEVDRFLSSSPSNFQPPVTTANSLTATTSLSPKHMKLVDTARTILNQSRSAFVREAVIRLAEAVVARQKSVTR